MFLSLSLLPFPSIQRMSPLIITPTPTRKDDTPHSELRTCEGRYRTVGYRAVPAMLVFI